MVGTALAVPVVGGRHASAFSFAYPSPPRRPPNRIEAELGLRTFSELASSTPPK